MYTDKYKFWRNDKIDDMKELFLHERVISDWTLKADAPLVYSQLRHTRYVWLLKVTG